MTYIHTIARDSRGFALSLSIFPPDGHPVVATPNNDGFAAAVAAVQAGKHKDAIDHLNPSASVSSALRRWKEAVFANGEQTLADGVKVTRHGQVTINGEAAHPAIAKTIMRYYREGSKEDFLPLVRFLQNIADNPNEHSREQLYEWLDHQSFSITADGCFIGYKGVSKDHRGHYVSSTNMRVGDGVVSNGTPVEAGQPVPNPIGGVVSMPREAVNHNPSVGCSTGLHVGTWGYASGFGSYTLSVKVNPRDVASVPTDCAAQKVRCSQYEVVAVTERERVRALSRIGANA